MPLFIYSASPSHIDTIAPGIVFDAKRVALADAQAAMDADVSARLIFEILTPLDSLTIKLRNGDEPTHALENTTGECAATLKVYRSFRRRSILVDISQGRRRPEMLREVLQAWRSGEPLPEIKPAPVDDEHGDAMAKIIASVLIKSSRDAARLAEEIDASLTPLEVRSADQFELAQRAAAQLHAPATQPVPAAQKGAQPPYEERALRTQRGLISQLQSDLDKCLGELMRLYAEPTSSTSGASGEIMRRLNEAELARDALRADFTALEVETSHLHRDNRQLRETLAEIRGSNSWKITAPLRNLRGAPAKAKSDQTG